MTQGTLVYANNSLRRYTELPYLIEFLSSGKLFIPNSKSWDDRNDSFYLEQYARLNNIRDTYALCLTQAPETYHHWKVFSSGSSGVCIVFNKEKFLQAIYPYHDLVAKSVDYKTISELKNRKIPRDELPFLKRFPYRDDCEFRLFAAPTVLLSDGYRIEVPKKVICKIIISPWLPKSIVFHIKELLKNIKGCSNIKIHGSTLVENEEWKKFSDNAI